MLLLPLFSLQVFYFFRLFSLSFVFVLFFPSSLDIATATNMLSPNK